jgi:hypothetical protein
MPIFKTEERNSIDFSAKRSVESVPISQKRKRVILDDDNDPPPVKGNRPGDARSKAETQEQRALRSQFLDLFALSELWEHIIAFVGYEVPAALDLAFLCKDFYNYFMPAYIIPHIERFLLYYTDPNHYSGYASRHPSSKYAVGTPRSSEEILEFYSIPKKDRSPEPKDWAALIATPSVINTECGISRDVVDKIAALYIETKRYEEPAARRKIYAMLVHDTSLRKRALIHYAFLVDLDKILKQTKFGVYYANADENKKEQKKKKYSCYSKEENDLIKKVKLMLKKKCLPLGLVGGLYLPSESTWHFSLPMISLMGELRRSIKDSKVVKWDLTSLFHMACHMAVRTKTEPGEVADLTIRLFSDTAGEPAPSKDGAQILEMHWKLSIAHKDSHLAKKKKKLSAEQKQANKIVESCSMVCYDNHKPLFASTFEYDEESDTDYAPFYMRKGEEDKLFGSDRIINILNRLEQEPAKTFLTYAQTVRICSDCGRDLTDATSQAEGVGPVCKKRIANKSGEYFYECCDGIQPVHQRFTKSNRK